MEVHALTPMIRASFDGSGIVKPRSKSQPTTDPLYVSQMPDSRLADLIGSLSLATEAAAGVAPETAAPGHRLGRAGEYAWHERRTTPERSLLTRVQFSVPY